MRRLRFEVERSVITARHESTIILRPVTLVGEELRDAVWESVSLDIGVTIGGVTVPAAMWEDPEHWAENWAEELSLPPDEALSRVTEILVAATEES